MLTSSIAIVIGPTPPGTGVIAAATSAAASKSTSPQSPSSLRFMPTSMTTAPGLIASAPSRRGTPTAATRTSARLQTAARSRVREWQTVTVAFAASSSRADRHPDQLRAADDDGLGALQVDALVGEQLHHPGRGAGNEPGRAVGEQAGVGRRQPVDVLGRVDRRDDPVGVDLAGQRKLDEDPVDAASSPEPGDKLQQLVLASSPPAGRGGPTDPGLLAGAVLVADVDLGRRVLADQDRRQGRPPARLRRVGRDLARDPLADRGRDRLAVDDPRRHAYRFRIGA